jgi:16S rRNA (uracil1498-N3)-methyltransferase
MQIFYVPEIINGICVLDKTESHHCSRVLRKNAGDTINCVDGLGGYYLAEIMPSDPLRVMAKII